MKALGVDPGERRIGLAIGEDDVGVALPLETVAAGPAAARVVAEVVRSEEVDEVVVGLPLRLDGTEGPSARRARALGESIARELGRPVQYWDERLTTAAANRALSEMGVRGRDRRKVVDQSAAALILQGYLDAHRRASGEEPWLEENGPQDDGREAGGDGAGRRVSRGR